MKLIICSVIISLGWGGVAFADENPVCVFSGLNVSERLEEISFKLPEESQRFKIQKGGGGTSLVFEQAPGLVYSVGYKEGDWHSYLGVRVDGSNPEHTMTFFDKDADGLGIVSNLSIVQRTTFKNYQGVAQYVCEIVENVFSEAEAFIQSHSESEGAIVAKN